MNLQVSFSEISEFINREVKALDFKFSQVDEQTLRVALSKTALGHPIHIADVDLSIDRIDGNDIFLTLGGGVAVDTIVKGAVLLLQDKMPAWLKQVTETTFLVQLDKIEKAQIALQYLALKDITVLKDSLQVVVSVK